MSGDPAPDLPPAVRAALEASGLPYEVLPCDPALADTATFCAHYGVAPEDSANAILVKTKTGEERFAVCVVLATTRLDVNKCVRKRLGARKASFAGPDETRALTGMEPGGVTPLGLPADLPLWIDARVMARPEIVLGAGTRAAKIKVSPAVLRRQPAAEIVDDLALEPG